jgi:DNA-binding response OmpR family regulator
MKKILLIDDETRLRESIAELFDLYGYSVCEACDGREGLLKVKQFEPDIIICDIMMPVLDGYGFLSEIKSSIFAEIPVILLSAKIEQSDELKGKNLGANAYIKKPFDFKKLKEVVDSHIL